jgi:hypothetical protein
MTTPGHKRLADLAERVRGASSAMHAASRETTQRALGAGRLLARAGHPSEPTTPPARQ